MYKITFQLCFVLTFLYFCSSFEQFATASASQFDTSLGETISCQTDNTNPGTLSLGTSTINWDARLNIPYQSNLVYNLVTKAGIKDLIYIREAGLDDRDPHPKGKNAAIDLINLNNYPLARLFYTKSFFWHHLFGQNEPHLCYLIAVSVH